ncbi:cytochrome P450, family 71, subfamily B, polypeptide 35 [Hibiscus trionum]|uniref:Cytochrome P450, family 71, subfamily B, polypeptide 35 n=1 Tax=Hibiscus trionum TaxID=183268 RepID=A0A9W7I2B4_HIBTR|nr:cytochrome P450, family 71, subfamily B, polypeptide 35 [Hibiscus trionum]
MDYFILQTIFISLIALFFTSYMRKWHASSRASPSLTPPSPPSLPIIGHLHLLTEMPHHTFSKLAEKLGPIIYLRLGQVPTVVVSSPKLARLVLKTHDHVFSNRPQLVSAQYLSFNCSDVTFSPYGPYWRQARKICVTELLSSKRVSSFQLVRDQEVNRLLNTLSTKSGSEVNVSELFFSLANDILCRVAFGRRFTEGVGSLDEGEKRHLAAVLTETQELFAGMSVGDFFPEWEWIHSVSGYKRRLTKNLNELRRVCDEIIEEHLNSKSGGNKEDFVDVLLRVQKQDNLEIPITDDNLKALVLDMFVAGTDTTAATLEWTMTELAKHPELMKQAQQEVRTVARRTGKVVDESHRQHLHFIKSAIKETTRLHPSVPLLVPRESMDECILDGYKIPAKTRVLINTYAIGRDPDAWDNPLQYNPQRFEDSNVDVKDQDFRFLPFGGGRRGCPGYTFGLATVEIALARLLFHFDWELPRGYSTDDVDVSEIFGLATRKRTPLVLVPTVNKELWD